MERQVKEMIDIRIDTIEYAADPYDAKQFAERAIGDLDKAKGRVLVGFDTEGSIKTLQLHFAFADREYSQIYQLNKILHDDSARRRLRELLLHAKIIFTGKSVNEEIITVLQMCGAKDVDVMQTRIIESQRCFEVVEMITRGNGTAVRYLEDRHYSPSFHLPKNPFVPLDKQRQEDLGLKTIFKFFHRKMTMSKRYEMRCPYWVDWACRLPEPGMTNEMKCYAAGDAFAGYRVAKTCGEALSRLGFSWEDLIENVDMTLTRNLNAPFNSGRLSAFFRRAVEVRLSRDETDNLRRFRNVWETKLEDAIIEERETRIERYDRVKALQDAWDDANGFDRCELDYDEADMTVAQMKMDAEEAEFEAVKYAFPVNTPMHTHACQLLCEYDKQRGRISMFERGVDIEEAEAASLENTMAWIASVAVPDSPPRPSQAPLDPKAAERRRIREEEKRREEEDPDRFWACKHLEEMVEKKKAEAQECIEQQKKAKKEKEEERLKEVRRQMEEEEERLQAEERRQKERRREEKNKKKEEKRRKRKMKEEYYEWEKKENENRKEEDAKIEESRQKIRDLKSKMDEEEEHLVYISAMAKARRQKTEAERARLLAFIEDDGDNGGDGDDDGNEGDDDGGDAVDPRNSDGDNDVVDNVVARDNALKRIFVAAEKQAAAEPVVDRETDERHETEETESTDPLEINPDDVMEADEFVFHQQNLALSDDDTHTAEPAQLEAPAEEEEVYEPLAKKAKRNTLFNDTHVLDSCSDGDVKKMASGIFSASKGGGDYFLEILRQIRDKERRARVASVVKDFLRDTTERRRFCLSVIHEKLIDDEYLRSAIQLSYYEIDPIIVINHEHHKNSMKETLAAFVEKFPMESIEDLVGQLVDISEMSEADTLSFLRSHNAFPTDYLSDQPDKRLKAMWMLRLARDVCDARKLEYPPKVRSFPMEDLVGVACALLKRGEFEVSDFLNDLKESRDRCDVTSEVVLQLLKAKDMKAASLWAAECELPAVEVPVGCPGFSHPVCNGNVRLHNLSADIHILFVDSAASAHRAINYIAQSHYVVARVVARTRKYFVKELLLFSILTDNALILLHLPTTDAQHTVSFLQRMRSVLRGRKFLIKDPPHFFEAVGGPFPGAVDANEAAAKVGYPNVSFTGFALSLTAGQFCMRGTQMPSGSRPSSVAVRHECLRLALLYEFFRQNEPAVLNTRDSEISRRVRDKLALKRKLK